MKLEVITAGLILLFIAAFAYVSSSQNHEWSGADGQAENVISDALLVAPISPGLSPFIHRLAARSRACSSHCRRPSAASSSAISWATTAPWQR